MCSYEMIERGNVLDFCPFSSARTFSTYPAVPGVVSSPDRTLSGGFRKGRDQNPTEALLLNLAKSLLLVPGAMESATRSSHRQRL